MTRRAAIVAAVTMALGLLTGPADAVVPRGETNGCIVVKPAHIAICLGRY